MTDRTYPQDIDCILPNALYISNVEAAQNPTTLRRYSIRAILTSAKGITLTHPRELIPFYLNIPGEDHEQFDLKKYFNQATAFIHESMQHGAVLVHCLAGVSRSVTLVLAYFIKYRNVGYQQAYDFVKAKRRIIHPNDGFITQLLAWQNEVSNKSPHCQLLNNTFRRVSPLRNNKNNPQYLKYQAQCRKYDKINQTHSSNHIYQTHSYRHSPLKQYYHKEEGFRQEGNSPQLSPSKKYLRNYERVNQLNQIMKRGDERQRERQLQYRSRGDIALYRRGQLGGQLDEFKRTELDLLRQRPKIKKTISDPQSNRRSISEYHPQSALLVNKKSINEYLQNSRMRRLDLCENYKEDSIAVKYIRNDAYSRKMGDVYGRYRDDLKVSNLDAKIEEIRKKYQEYAEGRKQNKL